MFAEIRGGMNVTAAGSGPARLIGTGMAEDAAEAHDVSILMAAGIAVAGVHQRGTPR